MLAVFQIKGHWGAIAKSNYAGCRYREPVYRSLRELAMSYFNIYFNMRGERTLRNFSLPVNLKRFDHLEWMTTEEPIWFIPIYLCDIHHFKLLRPGMSKRLHRVDERLFRAETLGKAHRNERRVEALGSYRGNIFTITTISYVVVSSASELTPLLPCNAIWPPHCYM